MSDDFKAYERMTDIEQSDFTRDVAEDPIFVPGASFQQHVPHTAPTMSQPSRSTNELFLPPTTLSVTAPESPESFMHFHSSLETRLNEDFGFDLTSANPNSNGQGFVLGLTSAIQGEGKTSTAFHLALTLARNSSNSISLMDFGLSADPETDLAHQLGLFSAGGFTLVQAFSPGIVDVLEEKTPNASTFVLPEPKNLLIVPAGSAPTHRARTCRSVHVTDIINYSRSNFALTIIDLPALSTGIALPIIRHLDGVILVAQYGVTDNQMISRAVEEIGKKHIVGFVMNRQRTFVPSWVSKLFRL